MACVQKNCSTATQWLTCLASSCVTELSSLSALVMRLTDSPTTLSQKAEYLVPMNSLFISLRNLLNVSDLERYTGGGGK